MSNALTGLSDALADAVSSSGVGVLRVEGRDRVPASGIIWSADGLVITAHHVLERDENISVGMPQGESLPATLVGRDPTTDLAVLRIDASSLLTLQWVQPDSLQVGHLALALARPGNNVQATMGIIGALGSSWRTHPGGVVDRYIQADLVMPPGFSGGPTVAADGNVVGLTTSALLRGISLALPVNTVKRVGGALLAHGRILRAYIGVGSQPARLPDALADQLGQSTGLLVVSVEPDGPAAKGGLFLGDNLVTIDGRPLKQLDDLLESLDADKIDRAISVRVVRGGTASRSFSHAVQSASQWIIEPPGLRGTYDVKLDSIVEHGTGRIG